MAVPGLLDQFQRARGSHFRPKSIARKKFCKFNNEVVLLQDGLERTYRGHDRLEPKLLVSNFSSRTAARQLTWEVTLDGRSLRQNHASCKPCPRANWPSGPKSTWNCPIDLALPLKIAGELDRGRRNNITTAGRHGFIRPKFTRLRRPWRCSFPIPNAKTLRAGRSSRFRPKTIWRAAPCMSRTICSMRGSSTL